LQPPAHTAHTRNSQHKFVPGRSAVSYAGSLAAAFCSRGPPWANLQGPQISRRRSARNTPGELDGANGLPASCSCAAVATTVRRAGTSKHDSHQIKFWSRRAPPESSQSTSDSSLPEHVKLAAAHLPDARLYVTGGNLSTGAVPHWRYTNVMTVCPSSMSGIEDMSWHDCSPAVDQGACAPEPIGGNCAVSCILKLSTNAPLFSMQIFAADTGSAPRASPREAAARSTAATPGIFGPPGR